MRPVYSFDEHLTGEDGRPTEIVIATCKAGFAISKDLGQSWKRVRVEGRDKHRFVHAKWIGNSEFLLQGSTGNAHGPNKAPVDLFVINESGKVLAEHSAISQRWHGCRAVGQAGGTLMYAEYPRNEPVNGKRTSSARVFRSRDRGRSWQVVFEQPPANIRHFHFLQPRPGNPGEWWLTSGDAPHESHIWVSKDDGDSWSEVTAMLPRMLEINGTVYERDAFRLTDLVWLSDDLIWATDDAFSHANPPGACVFRSKIGPTLAPHLVGRGQWHFRNIIDIGDHLVFFSQRATRQGGEKCLRHPGIYLMDKRSYAFTHIFDVDCIPSDSRASGFTFSRASRASKDGKFFTYRSEEDLFPEGQRIL
ncbi:MAG: hypothetical protein WDM89_08205, partial [Rhizomicrobium sp.]